MGANTQKGRAEKGKLYVIEGLDGSGKATQSRLIYERFREKGVPVRRVSFPNYESDSSALIRMYLRGDFGTDPMDVNPYAASTFYAADRYAGYKADWGSFYEEGGVIIADRYTTSNAVHQCSKLPEKEWDGFLEWLFHFEYVLLGIPEPDAVIYLEVDPAVSRELMKERYGGDESRKDIHERNVKYLEQSAKAGAYCAKRLGWKTVRCSADAGMRSVEDISSEIRSLLR